MSSVKKWNFVALLYLHLWWFCIFCVCDFDSYVYSVLRPGLYILWLCPSSALCILCMCYVFGFATCLWIIFRPNLWVSRVSLFITSFAVQVSDFALDRAHPLMLIGWRIKSQSADFYGIRLGIRIRVRWGGQQAVISRCFELAAKVRACLSVCQEPHSPNSITLSNNLITFQPLHIGGQWDLDVIWLGGHISPCLTMDQPSTSGSRGRSGN